MYWGNLKLNHYSMEEDVEEVRKAMKEEIEWLKNDCSYNIATIDYMADRLYAYYKLLGLK